MGGAVGAPHPDNTIVHGRDPEDGQQEEESVALVNGERAISIDIIKAQGENTIGVVDGVRRVVAAGSAGVIRVNPKTGGISAVTITSPGSGYTSAPAVDITSPGVTPTALASATAVISSRCKPI